MTNYRRSRIPGATYFFTVALADRSATTLVDEIGALRDACSATRAERPFRCDAFVVLPDHLHAVWTLPEGDSDYSTRWRLIKARFTRAVLAKMGAKHPSYGRVGDFHPSHSKREKGERGVWQRRFWEHLIRDERGYRAHLEYCWGNPVKHGLVTRAVDWPYSSIHWDMRAGRVGAEWSGGLADGEFGEVEGNRA